MLTNIEIISQIRSALKPLLTGSKLILFGSRARGDHRPESDVDLLILFPDEVGGTEMARRQLEISQRLMELELSWGMKIDVSPVMLTDSAYRRQITPFTRNIDKEGILL